MWDVVYSRDALLFASASADKTVRLWRASTGEQVSVLEGHDDEVRQIAFGADNETVVSLDWSNTVRFWEEAAQRIIRTVRLPGFAATLSPKGEKAVVVYADGAVGLFELSTGKELWKSEGYDALSVAVAFANNGTWLASSSRANVIHILAVASGMEIAKLPRPAEKLAFSPEDRLIASLNSDGTESIWDVRERTEVVVRRKQRRYRIDGSLWGGSCALEFSPDSKLIAYGATDGWLWLADTATGEVVWKNEGHGSGHAVNAVSFSPDGKHVASASEDGTVLIWDVADVTSRTQGGRSRMKTGQGLGRRD